MCTELFVDWKWQRELFKDKYNINISNMVSTKYCSRYNKSSIKKATLNYFISKAIMEFINNEEIFVSNNGEVTLMQRGSTLVGYFKNSGDIYASVKSNKNMSIRYVLKKGSKQGTDIFLSLLPTAFEDEEFMTNYTKLKELYLRNVSDKNALSEAGFIKDFTSSLFILNDNLYRRMLSGAIKIVFPIEGFPIISNKMLLEEPFSYSQQMVVKDYKTDFLEIEGVITATNHENHSSAYKLDESRILSNKEINMIPTLEDWFVIPKEAEVICKHAKMTTNTSMAMRNFMLSGPSGTGKTESARAIANGLGLPYLYFTCSANTEITDLVGQILPDMSRKSYMSDLPTLEDIVFSPSLAYEHLTGEKISSVSSQKVFDLYSEEIEKREKQKSEKQSYSFVYSPFIEAIRNGWVVEIQEPTVISNPGVLVGLNGLLDGGGIITLPNGETIKRHPDSVVIITTNDGYNGCIDSNQSVISRMNLIIRLENLSKEIVMERASKITNFRDKLLLERMYTVFEKMNERARETMIDDGVIGFREFLAWIQSTSITNDVYSSALMTIVSSASSYEENREELIVSCLDPILG